jgi:hypothetical protein
VKKLVAFLASGPIMVGIGKQQVVAMSVFKPIKKEDKNGY